MNTTTTYNMDELLEQIALNEAPYRLAEYFNIDVDNPENDTLVDDAITAIQNTLDSERVYDLMDEAIREVLANHDIDA